MSITPTQARAELAKRELARRGSPLNSFTTTEQSRREADSIPFPMGQMKLGGATIPSIPGFDIGSTLKTLGALGQREESAIAAPIEAASQGRFKDMLGEALKGAKGDKVTEFGGVLERKGVDPTLSNVLGFGASMFSPINLLATMATGGANKAVTPALGKSVGKVPGAVMSFGGAFEGKTIKDLRNIVRRIGKSKTFGEGIDSEGFIGRMLAPKVSKLAKESVESLEPKALEAIGVPADEIAHALEMKKKYGINRIPSMDDADDVFENTMKQTPFNKQIKLDNFRLALEDSIANLSSGLGKDSSLVKSLQAILDDTKSVSTASEAIKGGVGESLKSLTKKSYLSTRRNLNQLISGNNPEIDRLVMAVKNALDKDAAYSGMTGVERAKAVYEISRNVNKARNFINKSEMLSEKGIQNQLLSARSPEKVAESKIIAALAGEQNAGSILDQVNANRILTDTSHKGIGKLDNSGNLFGAPIRNAFRSIVRRSEETGIPVNVEDFMAALRKSSIGRTTRKTIGLAERATARKVLESNQ